MQVEVIDRFEALQELKGEWDAVYAADPEAQYFLSHAWTCGWFEKLSTPWIVLVAREAATQRCVALLPLQLRVSLGASGVRNELRTGGGTFAGYNGLICMPGLEREAIHALARQLRRLNWAVLHLENIALSPRRLRLFLNEFPSGKFDRGRNARPDDGDGVDRDIYVYVDLPNDWEAFLSGTLGPATRKNARRALRFLESTDDFRVTHATPETLDRDIDALLGLWSAQWAEPMARQHGAPVVRGYLNNFRRMLTCSAGDDALFLPVLWRGDDPIAAQANLLDRKNASLISLVSGRDRSVARPSPSFTLDIHTLRWAIENGFRTFDLLTGAFPYKYDLGGRERRIECLNVRTRDGRNPGGRLEPLSVPGALKEAEAARRDGRLQDAQLVLRAILEADPDCAAARRALEEIAPAPVVASPLLVQRQATTLEAQIQAAILKPSRPG